MARRLVEQGVRAVEVTLQNFDTHSQNFDGHKDLAAQLDPAFASLMKDLHDRQLLESTVVLCLGEFGRTPMSQGGGANPGRDHHIKGFSFWMAGGGIRGGVSYGATDEFGYKAVEDVVSVHDFHATMLHLLGIDHERFTYKFQGLDMRLTGVEPSRVLQPILA